LASEHDIDGLCEQILLASGHLEEAYAKYALSANRAATFLGWFRAVAKKYPDKPPGVVLADLVRHTPGEEGKWFAAAKDAKLFDEALALANATPCDPRTLTRAARDFARTNPAFAVEAGLAALRWLVQGYGYFPLIVKTRGCPVLRRRSSRATVLRLKSLSDRMSLARSSMNDSSSYSHRI
jgi:hypothetical protein